MIRKIRNDHQRRDALSRKVKRPAGKPAASVKTQELWVGVDELNFAEFPLAAIAGDSASGQKTLVFEDDIHDREAKTCVHRKLVISASDLYGLPTPRDSDVLLVLIELTKSVSGFSRRTVPFRRSELLASLGWDDSGKSYQRLDESLQRWASVTLYYNGAWWDKSVKRWRSRTFHVLESLDLRGREQASAKDDSLSTFTWNEVVFASFEAKNIRNLDLSLYFRLTRPASRQAYRFLGKRFWQCSVLELDLRTFLCEHVGFSRSYDNSQLKRKALPMLEELEQVGFLAPATEAERFPRIARGRWGIVLVKSRADPVSSPEASLGVQGLLDRGVQGNVAYKLALEFGEERVLEKLRLHDWLRGRKDRRMSKSSAGFLVRAIRGDFRPDDFLAVEQAPKRAFALPITTPAPTAASPAAGRHESLLRAWRAMPTDEQRRIEQEAVASAKSFEQETYQRLKLQDGKLFAEIRNELVGRFLEHQALPLGPPPTPGPTTDGDSQATSRGLETLPARSSDSSRE